MYGNLMAMLTIMKGIPLAYNTDMSEDKEQVYDSMDTLQTSLKIMAPMLEKMVILSDNTRSAAARGFSNATDMADYLVRKGIPFREAHHIVGSAVNYCIKHRKMLEELTRMNSTHLMIKSKMIFMRVYLSKHVLNQECLMVAQGLMLLKNKSKLLNHI